MLQQFLIVAAAHFLALLSPGPDFFLIARYAIAGGWLRASGACLGIASANGVFIAAAFCGVSVLRPGSAMFLTIQLAGCVYLLYVGALFIRHAGRSSLAQVTGHHADGAGPLGPAWWRAAAMGFLSGILNPKNALFYVSLAALVSGASTAWKIGYGAWMFGIVLLWDMLLAAAIGNARLRQRFVRALPGLERAAGGVLMLLATVLILATARQLSAGA